jgi:hypothetical protein
MGEATSYMAAVETAETALLLARVRFAFTLSFHFLFPSFSIGLASYLAVLEGLWLWTKKHVYLDLSRYWMRIFAVAFAMGVVSGIVMSYQFGTNWAASFDPRGMSFSSTEQSRPDAKGCCSAAFALGARATSFSYNQEIQ